MKSWTWRSPHRPRIPHPSLLRYGGAIAGQLPAPIPHPPYAPRTPGPHRCSSRRHGHARTFKDGRGLWSARPPPAASSCHALLLMDGAASTRLSDSSTVVVKPVYAATSCCLQGRPHHLGPGWLTAATPCAQSCLRRQLVTAGARFGGAQATPAHPVQLQCSLQTALLVSARDIKIKRVGQRSPRAAERYS